MPFRIRLELQLIQRTWKSSYGLIERFDAGIWSSLVQEVIVKAEDDIVLKFKDGFEVRV